ncbi:caspase family protein [Szabonella alba]|uniref:Caspase family protein n=1 Tax=Szabonella alba TaxID=2804194 RepID=A0A8K0XZV2_9RHOB|nr:caspase family protein [Szabonella alba]MBL4916172.1 caspase family protein [Szabonella alba]
MTIRRLLFATPLALALLPGLTGLALARENHALLIGASTYPKLEERFWLRGPANDMRLVATYLTTQAPVRFDPGNVTILADGVEAAAGDPTLAAIRAAFAGLTERVQPGDFVYLHFSGHGSQAPAKDPESELNGLDELFLPMDIGPWSDTVGTVENALVDDEIGQMLDALRARGADVWAVFDACHSGTATRAAPSGDEEVRMRQLAPEALGIPTEALDAVASRALPQPEDPRAAPVAPVVTPVVTAATSAAGTVAPGRLVAFFAAQSDEVTPEKRLPAGKPGRVPQGVFTYALFEALAEYPGATYAQIGQEVLRKYAVKNMARSTPLFEGDLDAVVFSGDPAPRVAQWPATPDDAAGFTLPAGSLHGLAAGALMAVMPGAAAPMEEALGYVALREVETFTARAEAVAHEGVTLPETLPRGVWLRRIGTDVDFTLTVALPEPGNAPADRLTQALDSLHDEAGPRLAFVAPGDAADLRLAVIPDSPRPDAIWILPATGLAEDLGQTPSVATTHKTGEELAVTLADTLIHMAKAINLLKLGAAVSGNDLAVSVDLMTRSPENRTLRALATTPVPRLVPDDEIHVEAANDNAFPVDVNVLYVGSDYSVTHMFAGRLGPGDRLRQGLLRITDEAFGRDRLVLVMTPAATHSAVENLSFLSQDAVEVTRAAGAVAQTARPGLAGALFEAGFGQTTRAAASLMDEEEEAGGPAPMILQFDLDTVSAD